MLEEKSRLEKRTVQYWYEDGIPEIGLGSTCLLLGGLYVLNLISISGGIFLGAILLMATIPYSYFCSRLLVRKFHALKEKWTYPRAGMLTYRGQDDFGQSPWTAGRLGLAALVAGGTLVLQHYLPASGALLFAMLGLAILLLYIAAKSGKARFYAFAVLSVGEGLLLLAFVDASRILRLTLFFASQGVLLSISGAMALRRFIKTHPIPSGDEA
jgi:hypothetical protein